MGRHLPESKYVKFEALSRAEYKTNAYLVKSNKGLAVLGVISWNYDWKQFVFSPEPDQKFNVHAMNNISSAMGSLNKQHKRMARLKHLGMPFKVASI